MAIPDNIVKKAQRLYNLARKIGNTKEASLGICANVMAESGFNEGASEVGGAGYGLGQWTPRQNLYNQGATLGYSQSECETFDVQCDILLRGDETGQWSNVAYTGYDSLVISPLSLVEFNKIKDIYSATINYMAHWERPSYDPDTNHKELRKAYAEEFQQKLKDSGTDPDPDPDPEPDPEPEPEIDVTEVKKFIEEMIKNIKKRLSKNIFLSGGVKNQYHNKTIILNNVLSNGFSVRVSSDFSDFLKKQNDELNKLLDGLTITNPEPDPDPDPDPDPNPDEFCYGVPFKDTNISRDSFALGQQFGPNTGDFRPNGFHSGLDFGSIDHPGTNVLCVSDGKVTHTGFMDGIYYYVVVKDKRGYNVIYQEFSYNNNTIKVNIGNNVKKGQTLATRDSDHLHLGFTKVAFPDCLASSYLDNGTFEDPLKFLGKCFK